MHYPACKTWGYSSKALLTIWYKPNLMCEHLKPLENYLNVKNIPETFRGKPWSIHCNEWIYFDCILNTTQLIAKFQFSAFVVVQQNDDPRTGTELGLFCTECNDAILGLHPEFSTKKVEVVH